jgi:hypothetical protein
LRFFDIMTSRCYDADVRTTLQIDDDLYKAAKSMALAENRTIGEIMSTLLRKALHPPDYPELNAVDLPSFRVSENAPPLTIEMVQEADEDIE